jgi:hypothetical protein
MEFDGYYVLSDLLEKPNLRPRALVWAGPEPSPAYLRRARGSPTRFLYGLASVLYVAFSAVLTVVRWCRAGWRASRPTSSFAIRAAGPSGKSRCPSR